MSLTHFRFGPAPPTETATVLIGRLAYRLGDL
jgi:hypothetical protein